MKRLFLLVLMILIVNCSYQTDVHSAKTTIIQPNRDQFTNGAVYNGVVYPRYNYVVVDPVRYYYTRHYRYCY
jgi:hypothetical protein